MFRSPEESNNAEASPQCSWTPGNSLTVGSANMQEWALFTQLLWFLFILSFSLCSACWQFDDGLVCVSEMDNLNVCIYSLQFGLRGFGFLCVVFWLICVGDLRFTCIYGGLDDLLISETCLQPDLFLWRLFSGVFVSWWVMPASHISMRWIKKSWYSL